MTSPPDDDEKRELRRQVAELREAVAALTRQMVAEEKRRLTIDGDRAIVRHKMQTAAATKPRRKVGRPREVQHPFRAWLDAIDESVEEYAARKRMSPSTVKAYCRTDEHARRPSMAFALDAQNEAGRDEAGNWILPANSKTWPQGIK